MVIELLNRQQWVESLTDLKEDKFAKTFLGKADMYDMWDRCYGLFEGGDLLGGICFTYSKRQPKSVNLQLLHTFSKHRKKGVGKILTEFCVEQSYKDQCEYFRVSSEKASVIFYERIGFKIWGQQKSGTSLCFGKLSSPYIKDIVYDENDPHTFKKVFEQKGCVVNK